MYKYQSTRYPQHALTRLAKHPPYTLLMVLVTPIGCMKLQVRLVGARPFAVPVAHECKDVFA